MTNSGSNCPENFDVFISYYSKTGVDFARMLKQGLRDQNVSAFLDEQDIPKSIDMETDEFRNHIDNAIRQSKNFFLIMTVGFNKRKEVARELKMALGGHKKNIFSNTKT